MSSYFELFQIPEQFDLNEEILEKNYRVLVAQFHPDKFAAASAFEQKQALMMSATLNEAHRVLANPLNRAAYLLQKNQSIEAEAPEHTQFEPEFLMQQMQWRETLAEAKFEQDFSGLPELKQEIIQLQTELLAQLRLAFEQARWENAAALVRKGRFVEKILLEINQI